MSSSLVRQALEFVDQEETAGGKRKSKRVAAKRDTTGQERSHPFKSKSDKQKKKLKSALDSEVSDEIRVEDNIKKLLALTRPTADRAVAEKIVKRAVKGKPLLEKIEVKKEEHKSILFPDEEPYSKFEKEPFCS